MIAGALEVQIFAGLARIQEDMKAIKNVVKTEMGGVKDAVELGKEAFRTLGLTLSVGMFGKMISDSVQARAALHDMSQKVGISVEDLAGLKHAAELSGISLTSMEGALRVLSGKMVDANNGVKSAEKAFNDLGISTTYSNGTMKSMNQIMIEVAGEFENMEDGALKSDAAVNLFGRSGLGMVVMLNEGADALSGMIEEGKSFTTVTAESAAAADVLEDKVVALNAQWGLLRDALIDLVVPALSFAIEKTTSLGQTIGGTLAGMMTWLRQGSQEANIEKELLYRQIWGDDFEEKWARHFGTFLYTTGEIQNVIEEMTYTTQGFVGPMQRVVNETKELTKEEKELKKAIDDIIEAQHKQSEQTYDLIDSLVYEIDALDMSSREIYINEQARKLGEGATLQQRLAVMAMAGALYDEKAAREAAGRAAEAQSDLVKEAAEQRAKAEEDAAERARENWQRTHEYLTNTFIDIFNNGKNAFDNIARAFKAMIERMIAEWLASGVMNLFGIGGGTAGSTSTNLLGSIFGGGGGGGSSNPIGTISSIASSAGTIGNLASTAATIAGTWGTTAGWVAPSMANAATLGAAGTGAAAGGGFMSGLGSTVSGIGSAVWGGMQSIGSGIMNVASAIPGWGWVVAGLAAAATLLDKEKTPSHNAGFLTSVPPSLQGSPEVFEAAEFASGVDVYGWTRRQPQDKAIEVIGAFATIDSLLSNLLRGAGYNVDLTGADFPGYNEKGLSYGGGVFWGSAGEEGKPGTDLDAQLNNYARRFVEVVALKNGLGLDVINSGLAGAVSVDEIVRRVALAVGAVDGSHAAGLSYVPYDGYIAMLHKGEKVQTASEARTSDSMIQELTAEVRKLSAFAKKTADILVRVSRDGESILTEAA